MIELFLGAHPVMQALLATCFTWAITALGAAAVFAAKDISRRVLDGMLGFASGVMIAASYWSLLAPAIALSEDLGLSSWYPSTVGFLAGALFLWTSDRVLPHLHIGFRLEEAVGIRTGLPRSSLLVL